MNIKKITNVQTGALLLLFGILGIVFAGLAVSQLWVWFVAVPFGIAAIGFAHALGLSVLANLFLRGVLYGLSDLATPTSKPNSIRLTLGFGKMVAPLIALFCGFVLHYFM